MVQMRERAAVVRRIAAMRDDPRSNRAIVTVQKALRGHHARVQAVRRREALSWRQLSCERRVLVVLVYVGLGAVLLFMLYINVLYGLKFTQAQARAWVLASLTAFLTEALVNQPVVIGVREVVAFGRRVARSCSGTDMARRVLQRLQQPSSRDSDSDITSLLLEEVQRDSA
jgi:ribosomal protein L18E